MLNAQEQCKKNLYKNIWITFSEIKVRSSTPLRTPRIRRTPAGVVYRHAANAVSPFMEGPT